MSRRTSNTNLLSPQIRQTLNNLSQRIFYHEPKNYSELQNEDPGKICLIESKINFTKNKEFVKESKMSWPNHVDIPQLCIHFILLLQD